MDKPKSRPLTPWKSVMAQELTEEVMRETTGPRLRVEYVVGKHGTIEGKSVGTLAGEGKPDENKKSE